MNPPAHYRLAKPALTITRSGQSPLPLRSGFTGAAKIWQVYTGGINAPGLGSAPQLGDGSYALLLVSDELAIVDNVMGKLHLVVYADARQPGAWRAATMLASDMGETYGPMQ